VLTKVDLDQLRKRSLPAVKNLGERNLLKASAAVMGEGAVPDKLSAARMTELLGAIEPLLKAKSTIVSGYGCGWLWKLATKHQAARDKVQESFASLPGPGRLRLVQSLGFSRTASDALRPLELEMLRAGLKDKTAKVRLFAAERAITRLYLEMIPDLERASTVETDEAARRSMLYVLPLLTHGYEAKPVESDPAWCDLSVVIKAGHTASFSAPTALVEEVGAAEIARRYRARKLDHTIPYTNSPYDPLPPDEKYKKAGCWPPDQR
jgi:hypothetical protein